MGAAQSYTVYRNSILIAINGGGAVIYRVIKDVGVPSSVLGSNQYTVTIYGYYVKDSGVPSSVLGSVPHSSRRIVFSSQACSLQCTPLSRLYLPEAMIGSC